MANVLNPMDIQRVGATPRETRRPSHPFRVNAIPFQIVPVGIAPILPGETLKGALIQARAISDPILAHNIGWWGEFYLFYVRLRDLADREAFMAMVVDPNSTAAGLTATADVRGNFFAASATTPGINYVDRCLKRVTEVYFRDSDETATQFVRGVYPLAKRVSSDVFDSYGLQTEWATGDVNVDLDANATITASEVERARAIWFQLASQGLTNKTYDEFLASYGIRQAKQENFEPELIRYVRDWTYPTRLVEPSTGAPTSAVQWSMQERVDKDRFFREPGFLFGCMVFRPKTYLKFQAGTATAYMKSGLQWLPGEVLNDPSFGHLKFAASTGPHEAATNPYQLDIRDLLHYGEQFTNVVNTATDMNYIGLPTGGSTNVKYPLDADVDAMFVSGAANLVRVDGVMSFTISGHLRGDVTATTAAT